MDAALGDGHVLAQLEELVGREAEAVVHGGGELAPGLPADAVQAAAEHVASRPLVGGGASGQADVLREPGEPAVGQGRPHLVAQPHQAQDATRAQARVYVPGLQVRDDEHVELEREAREDVVGIARWGRDPRP